MSKLEIKDKIISSMDKYGLMPYPNQNRIKSTTEFYLLCKEQNMLDAYDFANYFSSVDSLYVEKGLLCRYPDEPMRSELEQHDDYISVCCSCGINKDFSLFAKEIFYYGLKHFFYYANRPVNTFKEWLSCIRQPYQITIFALCGGVITTLLSFITLIGIIGMIQLWGAIIIEGIKNKEDTSGKLLIWQLSRADFAFKFLILIPLWIFKLLLKKKYGEYITQELFTKYYRGSLLQDFAKEIK